MFDSSASGTDDPTRGGGPARGNAPDAAAAASTAAAGTDEQAITGTAHGGSGISSAGAGSAVVADFAGWLAGLAQDVPDAELLDRVRALEDLKAAASAAQARATASFDASQRATQAQAGTRKDKPGEGVASQVALARRDSPARGSRHLGMAHALTGEMPHTLSALTTGALSEWRATLLVRETACLDTSDRTRVDEALASDPKALEGLGDKRLIAAAKKEAYRLDPHSVVRRAAKAATERTVTCRPAPDTMTYLTGLLPVSQGVAVQAALERAADQLRATGDERGRGQIMADTLVDRITRPEHHRDGKPGAAGGAGIEIQLVMTDRTLLAGDHEPAHLQGYGTVPAGWARNLLHEAHDTTGGAAGHRQNYAADNANGNNKAGSSGGPTGGAGPGSTTQPTTVTHTDRISGARRDSLWDLKPRNRNTNTDKAESQVWVRRLYTAPGTGQLIAMDSAARIFPKNLRKMIIARDQTCRTPWCDAPIRHIDHVLAHVVGGKTQELNGQGVCERCNLAKTATGYQSRQINGHRHTVETITPTGHTYHSTAPPLPGTEKPEPPPERDKPIPPPGTDEL